MAPNVRNALRQKVEAEDRANQEATQRLLEAYRDAAAGADAGPIQANLRALLDQVHLVRPRLADNLRATIDLLVEVTARGDTTTVGGGLNQGTKVPASDGKVPRQGLSRDSG